MRFVYNIIFAVGTLLFFNSSFAQPYVKFEEEPAMEIVVNERSVDNLKVKYNSPTSGVLYVALLRDGKGIGNTIINITRGKRVVDCNIYIWDQQTITKKGKYSYRLKILRQKGDWDNVIAETLVDGVKAIKKR